MALFVAIKLIDCAKKLSGRAPDDDTPAQSPRTLIGRRTSRRPKLADRGPTIVAALFVIIGICCFLVAVTGAAVIGVAATAHKQTRVPTAGAIAASFIPTAVATLLATSVAIELCIESGRCVWWTQKNRLQRISLRATRIEMDDLSEKDFAQSSVLSSESAMADDEVVARP